MRIYEVTIKCVVARDKGESEPDAWPVEMIIEECCYRSLEVTSKEMLPVNQEPEENAEEKNDV